MGVDYGTRKNICQFPPESNKDGYRHLNPRTIKAVGLTILLTTTGLTGYILQLRPLIGPIIDPYGSAESDIFLLRMDDNGGLLWNKTYGSLWDGSPYSLVELSTAGFAIASASEEDDTLWLTRLDATGDVIWNRTYGKIAPVDVDMVETRAGGFAIIFTNITNPLGGPYATHNISILITDSAGQPIQMLSLGPRHFEACCYFAECDDGGFVYAGFCAGMGGWFQIRITRYDAGGDVLWAGKYVAAPDPSCHGDVIQDTDGGFVFGSLGNLSRTDNQGNVSWSRQYDGLHGGYSFLRIIQCSNGDFLLSSGDRNCSRINDEGDVLWSREIVADELAELSTGKLILVDKEADHFSLECLDANGNDLWNQTFAVGGYSTNLVTCCSGGFLVVGTADPSALAAALNVVPRAWSMLLDAAVMMVMVGGIPLIVAALIIVIARKPSRVAQLR